MIAKFFEAAEILARNLWLFSAIILTVWLPGNIVVNYATRQMDDTSGMGSIRLTSWIEGIFGPIYVGALI